MICYMVIFKDIENRNNRTFLVEGSDGSNLGC